MHLDPGGGAVLKRILLGLVLVAIFTILVSAAYEFWVAQGEIVVNEAMTVTWDGGDGNWDAATLTWTASGYPGESLTASFRVQNDGNEPLNVVATVVVDQPVSGVTTAWQPTSACINGGKHEVFELGVAISAEAAPETLLISFTFQREECP